MIPYDQATNYNKTRHFCNNKKQNLANKYQNTNFRVEITIYYNLIAGKPTKCLHKCWLLQVNHPKTAFKSARKEKIKIDPKTSFKSARK